jgi:hypothetical protein
LYHYSGTSKLSNKEPSKEKKKPQNHLLLQMWYKKKTSATNSHQQGEDYEAISAYHTQWEENDPSRRSRLGQPIDQTACPHSEPICPTGTAQASVEVSQRADEWHRAQK